MGYKVTLMSVSHLQNKAIHLIVLDRLLTLHSQSLMGRLSLEQVYLQEGVDRFGCGISTLGRVQ